MRTIIGAAALVIAAIEIAAGIGFAAGQSQTEEVRVVARSLVDRRIEFGVEHDGELVLRAGRYMGERQISAYDGRWLRSTPVQIEFAQRTDHVRHQHEQRPDWAITCYRAPR